MLYAVPATNSNQSQNSPNKCKALVEPYCVCMWVCVWDAPVLWAWSCWHSLLGERPQSSQDYWVAPTVSEETDLRSSCWMHSWWDWRFPMNTGMGKVDPEQYYQRDSTHYTVNMITVLFNICQKVALLRSTLLLSKLYIVMPVFTQYKRSQYLFNSF